MKVFVCILSFLLVSASAKKEEEEEEGKIEKSEGIYILTEKNYNKATEDFKYLLVEFYAPWCGHCKALEPEYVKAAQELLEKDSPIKLAKVDGTAEEALLKQEHVTGYPTIKFYRDGVPIKYGGGRMAAEIVEWVERKIGPWATPLPTASEVKDFIADNDVAVVGFFKDPESDQAKKYLATVRDFEDYPCGITSNEEAFTENSVKGDEVVLFKKFDEGRAVYAGAISEQKLLEFINLYALPLVVEWNHDTAQKIFSGVSKSHVLLFLSKSSADYEKQIAMARKLAEEFRHKIMFVDIDTDEDDNRRVVEFLGLKDDTFPSFRIIQMKDEVIKYKPEDTTVEENNLRKFIQDYLDGQVPVHYLTEKLPEDWNEKPVKYLTASNFDDVVLDKSKNVLVEFYAPWCGHCKQLAPVWEKVAETLAKKKSDVVVAKIDATVNELPHTRVRSFPTIKLYKKGQNEEAEYNGERTEEGILKFLDTDGVYGMAAPDHDEL